MAGRKKIDLDKTEFERLCEIQCTAEQIAHVFGVDRDTVTAWCKRTYGKNFDEVFREKRAGGLASLRKKQWDRAVVDGDTTMLIFLGKTLMDMVEKKEVIVAGNIDASAAAMNSYFESRGDDSDGKP